MDYRSLLQKYMQHVKQAEGTDFTDRLNQSYGSDVSFTDEEQKELFALTNSSVDSAPILIDMPELDWFGSDDEGGFAYDPDKIEAALSSIGIRIKK